MSAVDRYDDFLGLHRRGEPLIVPNPWDVGTAKLFVSLGFRGLATTSAGFAATLGRFDGAVSRDEAVAHAAEISAAVDVPVTADFENGFAHDAEGVAETLHRAARETQLAGCSVEDWSGERLYGADEALDRVRAAVEAAHGGRRLVLTARAENHLRGNPDLDDTIARLQSFQEAGADVVYAPGLRALEDIRRLTSSVDVPVNVLLFPGGPTVGELAGAGVARISVGSALHLVSLGAVVAAARELLDGGGAGLWPLAGSGAKARDRAFSSAE